MPSVETLQSKLERLHASRSNMQRLHERAVNDNTRNWASLEMQTLDIAIESAQADLDAARA